MNKKIATLDDFVEYQEQTARKKVVQLAARIILKIPKQESIDAYEVESAFAWIVPYNSLKRQKINSRSAGQFNFIMGNLLYLDHKNHPCHEDGSTQFIVEDESGSAAIIKPKYTPLESHPAFRDQKAADFGRKSLTKSRDLGHEHPPDMHYPRPKDVHMSYDSF
jgi:hypothetical protein